MWMRVRLMDGKKSIRIRELSKMTTIEDLRKRLVEPFNAPVELQRLFYRGKELEDGHSLFQYDVADNYTIYLVIKPDLENSLIPKENTSQSVKNNALQDKEEETVELIASYIERLQMGETNNELLMSERPAKCDEKVVRDNVEVRVEEPMTDPTSYRQNKKHAYGGTLSPSHSAHRNVSSHHTHQTSLRKSKRSTPSQDTATASSTALEVPEPKGIEDLDTATASSTAVEVPEPKGIEDLDLMRDLERLPTEMQVDLLKYFLVKRTPAMKTREDHQRVFNVMNTLKQFLLQCKVDRMTPEEQQRLVRDIENQDDPVYKELFGPVK